MESPEKNSNKEAQIHSTAIVAPGAQLGAGVLIGPYCIVGPDVVIGNDVILKSHVVINGITRIGDHNVIYPFACLGDPPQDLSFHSEPSELIIGSYNHIGHYVTFNGGTERGGLITRIGNYGMFMDGCHVAHDCEIGDHVVIANQVLLGGHVKVGDNVVIGGASAIVQKTRVGQGAMISGHSGITKDIIPYGLAYGGFNAKLIGLNIVGMKRLHINNSDIHAVHHAYKLLFDKDDTQLLRERLEKLKILFSTNPYVHEIITFIEQHEKKPICTPYSNKHNLHF